MTDFKLQKIIIIALMGVVAVTAVSKAMKPDPGLLEFRVRGQAAYGYGTTNGHSLGQITRFFHDNPQVKTLVLKNMPGTTDALVNTRLARRIRQRGLNTHLERDSRIASGAVDLFLAGTERSMECGALIGVHSWSSGKHYYPAKIKSDPYQKGQERFLNEMGIDPAFYAFTRDAALPDEIYYLSAKEIEKFGLLTQPVDCEGT